MPTTSTGTCALYKYIVACSRSGRSVEELAREFEPCAATIHGRHQQADRDGGRRTDAPQ